MLRCPAITESQLRSQHAALQPVFGFKAGEGGPSKSSCRLLGAPGRLHFSPVVQHSSKCGAWRRDLPCSAGASCGAGFDWEEQHRPTLAYPLEDARATLPAGVWGWTFSWHLSARTRCRQYICTLRFTGLQSSNYYLHTRVPALRICVCKIGVWLEPARRSPSLGRCLPCNNPKFAYLLCRSQGGNLRRSHVLGDSKC